MTYPKPSPEAADRTGLYAFFCLVLVGALLALSLVVAKLADAAGAPRLTFLLVAITGAGVVLFGISALQRQPMSLTRRTLEYAIVSGALFAMPNALGFLAVRHVGAGFISLSFALPILVTWLLAVLLGLERLRALRFIGVLLGLAGGLVLAAAKAGGADGAWIWVGLVLAIPLVLALGNMRPSFTSAITGWASLGTGLYKRHRQRGSGALEYSSLWLK